ncbi:hypothetical protein D3C72_2451200 [compost metagenome]
MRVDAARHQILANAIEYFAAWGGIQVIANGLDHAVGAQDIRAVTIIMGNDGGATDQQRHSGFLAGMTG